jgi:ABC-2 type transport system permease protein
MTAESRDLLDDFRSSGYFEITGVAGSYSEVAESIDSGKTRSASSCPPDFAVSLRRGESAAVQVLVDASDNMVASSAIATANSIGLIKSQQVIPK